MYHPVTSTTVLHTAVAREIQRMRDHMGYRGADYVHVLEAHHLAEQLTRTVTELLEHARQLVEENNYN
jgi:hypothetical protein